MRALVIANADDADPGIVGERFRHHGVGFTDCLREHPGDWPDVVGRDLVLLLGSEWSVYWEQVAASVPVFGICFGAQITARALGGTVERARRPEVGWHHVETDRPDLIAPGPWLQWHFDVFSVPSGLTEIARSPSGPQAMVGPRLLATQFHPEATETMLGRWTAGDPDDLVRLGLDPDHIMADTRREVVASRPRAEALVDWFVENQMGAIESPRPPGERVGE